jgi:predicted kinase
MYKKIQLPVSLEAPLPGRTRRLVVLQGLPASGKSTAARKAQENAPGRVAVVNNDSISYTLTGEEYAGHIKNMPAILSNIRKVMLIEALQTPEITLIIVDNTNLNYQTVEEYIALAAAFGAEFCIEDSFLEVPIEECIRRDSLRVAPVGENVIRRMHSNLSKRMQRRKFTPVVSQNTRQKEKAMIIDLDPVLRWLRDARAQDWANIYRRKLPSPAIELAKSLHNAGVTIIGVTSLSEKYAPEANVWVNVHVIPGMTLYMHEISDSYRSMMSKHAAYYNYIRPKYDVIGVIGEKEEVVHVWKNISGLPTFNISFGDF